VAVLVAVALPLGCAIALPPDDATPTERFHWSTARFDDEKYADAVRGFRDLLFREPLHATADSARFLLAEAYLRTNQQLLAANELLSSGCVVRTGSCLHRLPEIRNTRGGQSTPAPVLSSFFRGVNWAMMPDQ